MAVVGHGQAEEPGNVGRKILTLYSGNDILKNVAYLNSRRGVAGVGKGKTVQVVAKMGIQYIFVVYNRVGAIPEPVPVIFSKKIFQEQVHTLNIHPLGGGLSELPEFFARNGRKLSS